jgi:hypothetical protein
MVWLVGLKKLIELVKKYNLNIIDETTQVIRVEWKIIKPINLDDR